MIRSIPYRQEHPMHAARSTLLHLGAPFCIQQFPSRLEAAQKQSRKDPGIFSLLLGHNIAHARLWGAASHKVGNLHFYSIPLNMEDL